MMTKGAAVLVAAALLFLTAAAPVPGATDGPHPTQVPLRINPTPVRLQRPAAVPLSAMALLGRQIFFDTGLSRSGRQSCATCHQPAHAYGPADDAPASFGGPEMRSQGVRAVPSLTYLHRQPVFSIGPDQADDETVSVPPPAPLGAVRAEKTALDIAQSAAALVPQGGLFWDGRASSLQAQALGPMQNPIEMDGGSIAAIAHRLRHAAYAGTFTALFGTSILDRPDLLVAEAQFAVARYQIEDPSFHPYTGKFDYWLEGRAAFTPPEQLGYALFNDPHKGDCAACHIDKTDPDGTPPLFTDFQFEALGAPRNMALKANAHPAYYDLGVCGPYRQDMRDQTQYCGMFLTPSLRNVARRRVFFHNGVFHTLRAVLDFYVFRDVAPRKVYPVDTAGHVAKYNDLPPAYRANVDVTDPPFDRHTGDQPALTPEEEEDIIAYLGTLTDGYRP
jgi:cytochrome c peroxidase